MAQQAPQRGVCQRWQAAQKPRRWTHRDPRIHHPTKIVYGLTLRHCLVGQLADAHSPQACRLPSPPPFLARDLTTAIFTPTRRSPSMTVVVQRLHASSFMPGSQRLTCRPRRWQASIRTPARAAPRGMVCCERRNVRWSQVGDMSPRPKGRWRADGGMSKRRVLRTDAADEGDKGDLALHPGAASAARGNVMATCQA